MRSSHSGDSLKLAKNSSGIHRPLLAWVRCTTLGGADHPALSWEGGETQMNRIIVLVTVALLMAAMLAVSAMSASAVPDPAFEACNHAGVEHIPFCEVTS